MSHGWTPGMGNNRPGTARRALVVFAITLALALLFLRAVT